jgi:arylsulfatase A-like enzyme
MRSRLGCLALAAGLAGLPGVAGALAPSTVIFILLDTTRADHLSALGNTHHTTPVLDALAAEGVLFRRHYANAHATRPSMPQLMSGRYYHQNILGPFTPDAHPREFPFSRPDPTAILLPAVLRRNGYQTVGVSAHWWVVKESPFGADFDRLELVPVEASRGHADATAVVDRALALWHESDRGRPLFLYLHLMDMHMPRFPPGGELRFAVPGYDWERRFRPSGEPLFGRERRRWQRADARDFTALDQAHFAAVYDGRLAYADGELGRLFAAVRAEDPHLAHTLVVVTADHGEELGEEGRTDHTESLADGVQHIPWIVAGAGVPSGQRADRFTENIDVAPTLLGVLGIALPPGVQMDGRAQLAADGRLCAACGKSAAYYAWETYRAIRTRRDLLRQEAPGSLRARCEGTDVLYALRGGRRERVESGGRAGHTMEQLRRRLAHRLGQRERTFLATRYGRPERSFLVRADFWRVGSDSRFSCVAVDADTDRHRLAVTGWLWSGRGVTVLDAGGSNALPLLLPAPEGDYNVEAGAVPIRRTPWLLGFERWLRKSFLVAEPAAYIPLGTHRATRAGLSLSLPPDAALRSHIVSFRLTPPGVTPGTTPGVVDEEQRRRLRALGYVQ